MAADLCREYRVTAVDASRERVEALAAEHPVAVAVADLSCAEEVRRVVADADSGRAAGFCMACFDGDYRIPVYSLREKGKGALGQT